MIKKILKTALNLLLVASFLFTNAVLFTTKAEAASIGAKYFQNKDGFVIYPANNWSGETVKPYSTERWALNAQNGGIFKNQDIHLWENGDNTAFRIIDLNSDSNIFKIEVAKTRDSKDGLVWDIEGGSKDSGKIVHLWSKKTTGDTSQKFYLVDDKDNDPDTFYIKNLNSDKFLVPENFYKNPDNNDDRNEDWKLENSVNLIQSNYKFSWRISLLYRESPDAVKYFENDDYFVVSPAEMWVNGIRKLVPLAEWEITVTDGGDDNGDDLHMWQFGVDSKFRITGLDRYNTFRVQITNYQETKNGRFWDVTDRKPDPGAVIHAWSGSENISSKRFYLVNDDDCDPETFYIKNLNSGKYLVPDGYFRDPSGVLIPGKNWNDPERETKIIQSTFPFRWRINVLNRETPDTDDYTNWMSDLYDYTSLADLSIPGTHDACTANVELGGNPNTSITTCQKYFIDEQLIAGIRAFDLRTNYNKDSGTFAMLHGYWFAVCHMPGRGGSGSVNMTLASVLDEMIGFLKTHKRETLIVTLKIDSTNSEDIRLKLAKFMMNNYILDPDNRDYFYQWYDVNAGTDIMLSPWLADVRGKIVILSRVDFSDEALGGKLENASYLRSYMGPDLSEWDNNYDSEKCYAQVITPKNSFVPVWVQDDYQCENTEKEEQFFNTIAQLEGTLQNSYDYADVKKPNELDFVFNYTSRTLSEASAFTPFSGSVYMNNLILKDPRLADKKQRLGIVMMDFANKAVAARIIEFNNVFKHSGPSNQNSVQSSSYMAVNSQPVMQQPKLMSAAGGYEIVWPTSATVTYGYVLEEAKLNFDGLDKYSSISGFFYFENNNDILTVSDDNGKTQKLIFESYDGTVKESREIPVTVNRRKLPILSGNYQIEYGDTFDITQTPFPTAGGYFLPKDQEKLFAVIDAAGLHYKAVDENGDDIAITPETKPGSGMIRLTADNPSEIRHPNYSTSTEDGVWTINPRTVSVEWKRSAKGWTANIDNIINKDEVFAVVKATSDGKGAILTLSGDDADYYRIAEGYEMSPDNPETSDSSMFTVLMLFCVLGLCAYAFTVRKKHGLKQQ